MGRNLLIVPSLIMTTCAAKSVASTWTPIIAWRSWPEWPTIMAIPEENQRDQSHVTQGCSTLFYELDRLWLPFGCPYEIFMRMRVPPSRFLTRSSSSIPAQKCPCPEIGRGEAVLASACRRPAGDHQE
jgi:hypothetical protein